MRAGLGHRTRTLLAAAALCIAAGAGEAAEGFWNMAGSMGTYEHSVSDKDGNTLRLVNASGSGSESQDEVCYLTLETDKLKLPASYNMTIDSAGESFQFGMRKGQSELPTKTDREQLFGFVNSLLGAKKPTFTVRVPNAKLVFATKNARKALTDALDGCN